MGLFAAGQCTVTVKGMGRDLEKGHGFRTRDPKAVRTLELRQTEGDVVPLECVIIQSWGNFSSSPLTEHKVATASSLWEEREPQCRVGPPAGWGWTNWVSQDPNWTWVLPRP